MQWVTTVFLANRLKFSVRVVQSPPLVAMGVTKGGIPRTLTWIIFDIEASLVS